MENNSKTNFYLIGAFIVLLVAIIVAIIFLVIKTNNEDSTQIPTYTVNEFSDNTCPDEIDTTITPAKVKYLGNEFEINATQVQWIQENCDLGTDPNPRPSLED